jgi:uncharacterized protein
LPGSDNTIEAVKILISGGFGVGKTTMVTAVSEITPLRTEEQLTAAGIGVDDVGGVEQKTTTTVALDFGRITLSHDLVLYLFGTPGQQRFWFMWNDLAVGAIGGIVLLDTRRLESSFAAIDFFEKRGIPFVAAVNNFDGRQQYSAEQIRGALALDPRLPIAFFDARDRAACRDVLLTLVEHALTRIPAAP